MRKGSSTPEQRGANFGLPLACGVADPALCEQAAGQCVVVLVGEGPGDVERVARRQATRT